MAQKLRMLTGEVTAPTLGWTTDHSYHVVITETGVEVARGELRNPNFPTEVAVGEDWTGTIDGVNVGNAAGTFKFRMTPYSDCSPNPGAPEWPPDEPPLGVVLAPSEYAILTVTGTGPADFYICLMRLT